MPQPFFKLSVKGPLIEALEANVQEFMHACEGTSLLDSLLNIYNNA